VLTRPRQIISDDDVQRTRQRPVPMPPRRGVETAEIRRPVVWHLLDLPQDASVNHPHRALRLHQSRQSRQEGGVSTEILKGVNRNNGVEEAVGKRQRARIRTEREDDVLQALCVYACSVVGRRDPDVGRPHLDAVLAGKENWTQRLAAAQIKHAHTRQELQFFTQELGQPQRAWPHLICDHPRRVVRRGSGNCSLPNCQSVFIAFSCRLPRRRCISTGYSAADDTPIGVIALSEAGLTP